MPHHSAGAELQEQCNTLSGSNRSESPPRIKLHINEQRVVLADVHRDTLPQATPERTWDVSRVVYPSWDKHLLQTDTRRKGVCRAMCSKDEANLEHILANGQPSELNFLTQVP